jgi:hypothetical protein
VIVPFSAKGGFELVIRTHEGKSSQKELYLLNRMVGANGIELQDDNLFSSFVLLVVSQNGGFLRTCPHSWTIFVQGARTNGFFNNIPANPSRSQGI